MLELEEINLEKLEESIGYKFKKEKYIKKALRHRSYAHENQIGSNEKLEFLGDSILEFISSEYIFENYPQLKEGEMTKVRATVVCEKSLYKIAIKHNFGDFLYLGRSEKRTGGKYRPAILADSVEAVIAAIYLDGGLEPTKKFILENLKEEVEIASTQVGIKDYKTVLQEKLQENGEAQIEYIIINETGPDHDKVFEAQVICDGKEMEIGKGKTKKAAHMEAARRTLEILKEKR